jgi:hypothetical protein
MKEAYESTLPSVCFVFPSVVARHWLDKHVPAAMNTHATIEELLDVVFSMWSLSHQMLNM